MKRLIEILGDEPASIKSDDYEEKLKELRKERYKIQTANLERNRLDRAEARQELYYEYIKDAITTLPLPKFNEISAGNNIENMEYLLGIADIHYGAVFSSQNNEYSPEICQDRFELLAGDVIDFVVERKLSKLNICVLGDCIQGILRLNDLKLNDSSIVKATVDISRIIAWFLNEISKYTNVEYYHVPTANHTQVRLLGAKASELGDEDLEYLIGNYIKDLVKNNPRIKVHLAESGKQYIRMNINENNIVAMHGHTIRNMSTVLRDMNILLDDQVDYLLLGHYHGGKQFISHENITSDAEVIVNPGFVGSDCYSDSLMRGAKASVMIYGFNDISGLTETKKFILN